MTNVQMLQTLSDFFAKEMHGKAIAADQSLLHSQLLDSMAIVKLLAFIEEEFDVEIDDSDFDPENFETLNAIVALVANQRSA